MGKKNKKDPLVVYWSPYCSVSNQYQRLLTDNKLQRLMHNLIQRKSKNPIVPNSANLQNSGYQACPAVHELVNNTYIMSSPFDLDIFLNLNGEIIKNNQSSQYFTERISSFDNSFCIDLHLGILLFSEESINIELMHPYMNKTAYLELGFLTSAKYDIGRWLRPIPLIYQLWDDVRNFKVSKGDALAYIKFNTDRDIVFKQFEITEKIIVQAEACIDNKVFLPFQSLSTLYEKFIKSGFRASVLKEIKSNLL